MKRVKLIPKIAVAAAFVAGALITAAAPTQAAPGCKKDKNAICPLIFAPVTCDNGKTYSNSCFAAADCATNCVASNPAA